jgi:hypothetical protein
VVLFNVFFGDFFFIRLLLLFSSSLFLIIKSIQKQKWSTYAFTFITFFWVCTLCWWGYYFIFGFYFFILLGQYVRFLCKDRHTQTGTKIVLPPNMLIVLEDFNTIENQYKYDFPVFYIFREVHNLMFYLFFVLLLFGQGAENVYPKILFFWTVTLLVRYFFYCCIVEFCNFPANFKFFF